MDLVNKPFKFIWKQASQSKTSAEAVANDDIVPESLKVDVTLPSDSVPEEIDNAVPDDEILESIDRIYFEKNEDEITEFELTRLSSTLDCDGLKNYVKGLEKQQAVVSKKLLQIIMQKQSLFGDQLGEILDIQEQLRNALFICREGRKELSTAKQQFTVTSFKILASYMKRQRIQNLLHSFKTIKTLQKTEERLQELLNEGNYSKAIGLLLECQSAAATYRHFKCVAALSGKLQDTLEMAEVQLDTALAAVCTNFESNSYSKLQEAYRLLGTMQVDKLIMHFTTAIYNTSFNIVHGHVELCGNTPKADTQALDKDKFNQLCSHVSAGSFIPCLIDLCKGLWNLLRNYYQVVSWHKINDHDKLPAAGGISEAEDFEASRTQQYVKKKLQHGMTRIWNDVETKISAYILGFDIAWFKFDEFLQILGIVHRLIEVGDEFCGSKSEYLQSSIRQQSSKYFLSHHKECLEELKMFLESEGWEMCPVKSNFSILHLQEFRSLRSVLRALKQQESINVEQGSSPDCGSSTHSQDGSSVTGGYFTHYSETGTPFDVKFEETQEEDILADIGDDHSGYYSDESDEDVSEELKKDFVDENSGEFVSSRPSSGKKLVRKGDSSAPILTNTTLKILRLWGTYLQMGRLLRPIANDVIIRMIQLYEYYLYAVYIFFVTYLPENTHPSSSLKLQATLKSIENSLIYPQPNHGDGLDQITNCEVMRPQLLPDIDLVSAKQLQGLAKRVVAVESLIVLAKQFESLLPYLQQLVTDYDSSLYMQNFCVATDLRKPVYYYVAAHAVDYASVVHQMSRVDWDVKELPTKHSQYVDYLLAGLQIFSKRLEDISSRSPVPKEVYDILWENVIRLICETFVEGFSSAKKCSNEGIALMQLDFTQFFLKLEKLTTLRPIHKEYIEHYVKAYYLRASALKDWILKNTMYSYKHLLVLINYTCQSDKKMRQELLPLIENRCRVVR